MLTLDICSMKFGEERREKREERRGEEEQRRSGEEGGEERRRKRMMHFDFDGGLANHRFATRLLASKRDGHEKPALPTRRQQGQQAQRAPRAT